jgi:chemotaxis protein CheX
MAETYNYNELVKRYGLEPLPESVLRLTQLVSRQDANLDDIAKLIVKDGSLTARLLRAANPRAADESEYVATDVESALMRTGLGCALLLAMSTPLTMALVKTFKTMLDVKLESVNPRTLKPIEGEHLLGTIGFSGKASGQVFLRLSPSHARLVASRILGLAENELNDASDVPDAVGELLNIITGNLKSNLCDAGLPCRLTPPTVARTRDTQSKTVPGAGLERMAFNTPELTLFVDVSVNPWAD